MSYQKTGIQPLQDAIAELNAALTHGERAVRFGDGRQVEYRSVGDIISARDDLQRQLDAALSSQRRRRYAVQGGRGF